MLYYGTHLTNNLSIREPEGYLLCLNVPVARTGTQEYLADELGFTGGGVIPVYRPEDEVFSTETIASFEGMPVTNDHPADGVTVENIHALQKGHAHNIRRGTGDESDLLLADLIITDPYLIDQILHHGKREISCGYTYELHEENGRYFQRMIRGNHIAVVDAGRAGPRVSIRDQQPPQAAFFIPTHPETKERSSNPMKNKTLSAPNPKNRALARILARVARDGDLETVAEVLGEILDPAETTAVLTEAPQAEAPAIPAVPAEETPDEPVIAVAAADEPGEGAASPLLQEILSRLDQLIVLLTPAAPAAESVIHQDESPAAAPAEAAPETLPEAVAEGLSDVIAEALPEVLEESLESPEAGTQPEEISALVEEILGADPEPETPAIPAQDAVRAALAAVRPALAKLPKSERTRICGDIAQRLNKACGRAGTRAADNAAGIYAALARRAGNSLQSDPAELGRRIMEKRNINYKTV